MTYRAPLEELQFLLDRVVGLPQVAATERFGQAGSATVRAILAEAGRLAEEVLAPLNRSGDREGARLEAGGVRGPAGFAEAYRAIAAGGWVGMAAPEAYGGMGLPVTVAMAVNEMFSGACLALQLNPLLTQGQIEALEHHGSEAIRALYLPKLVSGEWSGTMNLTEPQAGSDVGALRCRAEPLGDGTYAVTGQKIYITWGDAAFMPNICHLVLARLPDAAAGTGGISLFLVPKVLPDAQGRPARPNALSVVGLEHKLGLHGSPTCVMDFAGAVGWLVGAPHRGMAAMFTMMNNARLGVAVQGVGVAEAALQAAEAFAAARVQGRTPLGEGPISGHADVRRMLAEMRAEVFSARAIALACAVAGDMARASGEAGGAAGWAARAAFLTPIAKAYGTDAGSRVADMAVQVHGGMGFIEETGVAQLLRDVRVTRIYEGTNGIQAMDLVGRKLADGGAAAFALLDEVEAEAGGAPALAFAAQELRAVTKELLAMPMVDRQAGAVAYLRAFALVLGAHFHVRAALADPARAALARVALGRMLPEYAGLLAQVRLGAADLYAVVA
ncbi:acyl-CoA dehydrogenase family protein [Paragemmobacter straminiformis]|uniref:Acyl-CoA dehydrogenase n=1 Tax=Paragemmobacter straminiformis TaxID=2045119 RepID=A0A842I559_9RHOB|nr:acyl-CoA dehydrogenase family protein [Gemmobacter straminiformis]MBC2834721.1 acyl-CoA dehydrogenase [Gemmobacter straminiformis]